MTRVTITWLDILVCFATATALLAYYGLGFAQFDVGVIAVSLVQHGKFIAIIYVALELLSAALGEGGNKILYWISYVATWTVTLVATLVGIYVFIGMQQSNPMIVRQLAEPYAKELLIFLVIFSWFSGLILQAHKHRAVWTEVTAARAIAPPAPIPPTVPPAVAPPVPGSAASVVIAILLLLLVAVVALATLGGGIRITTAAPELDFGKGITDNRGVATLLPAGRCAMHGDKEGVIGHEWRDGRCHLMPPR